MKTDELVERLEAVLHKNERGRYINATIPVSDLRAILARLRTEPSGDSAPDGVEGRETNAVTVRRPADGGVTESWWTPDSASPPDSEERTEPSERDEWLAGFLACWFAHVDAEEGPTEHDVADARYVPTPSEGGSGGGGEGYVSDKAAKALGRVLDPSPAPPAEDEWEDPLLEDFPENRAAPPAGERTMSDRKVLTGAVADPVVHARLGRIACNVTRQRTDIGDDIDRGLVLLRELEEAGFTVIGKPFPGRQPTSEDGSEGEGEDCGTCASSGWLNYGPCPYCNPEGEGTNPWPSPAPPAGERVAWEVEWSCGHRRVRTYREGGEHCTGSTVVAHHALVRAFHHQEGRGS